MGRPVRVEAPVATELRTGRHAALFSLGRLEEADEEYGTTGVQVRSLR